MRPTPAKYPTNNGTMKSPIPKVLEIEMVVWDEMRPEVVMHEGLAFHLAWKEVGLHELETKIRLLTKN